MVGFLGANGCFLLPSIEQNIPHFYEKRDSESIFKIFIKKRRKEESFKKKRQGRAVEEYSKSETKLYLVTLFF
jgi:hypothetical protein